MDSKNSIIKEENLDINKKIIFNEHQNAKDDSVIFKEVSAEKERDTAKDSNTKIEIDDKEISQTQENESS